jgi:hypothetical protein
MKFFSVDGKDMVKIDQVNKYHLKLSNMYYICALVAGFWIWMKPIITFIISKFYLHQEAMLGMPLRVEYLYDVSKSPAFEFSFLSSSWPIFGVVNVMVIKFLPLTFKF